MISLKKGSCPIFLTLVEPSAGWQLPVVALEPLANCSFSRSTSLWAISALCAQKRYQRFGTPGHINRLMRWWRRAHVHKSKEEPLYRTLKLSENVSWRAQADELSHRFILLRGLFSQTTLFPKLFTCSVTPGLLINDSFSGHLSGSCWHRAAEWAARAKGRRTRRAEKQFLPKQSGVGAVC